MLWSKSGQISTKNSKKSVKTELKLNQTVQKLKNPKIIADFSIDYPSGRAPRVRFRDPETGRLNNNLKISIFELNRLLSQPLPEISTKNHCEWVVNFAIREGLREKLFSKEKGKKLESILLKNFINTYWDYDNSPYLKKERELRGKEKGRTYCQKAQRTFINNCLPILDEDLRIDEFTPQMMEKIQLSMKENGKSNKTINEATSSIKIPLQEAFRNGIIPENVGEKIRLVKSSTKQKRGILTEEETVKLLTYLKESTTPGTPGRKLYLIVSLAYYGGMRIGEIIALNVDSLPKELLSQGERIPLHISSSYNEREKRVKCTKNGEERDSFPIPSEIINELIGYHPTNKSGFLFTSPRDPEKPWRPTEVSKVYSPTVEKVLGITSKEREERGIVFHSLRHETATLMIANGVDINLVQKGMGHKTREMTEHYSDHETEEGKKRFNKETEGVIKYI